MKGHCAVTSEPTVFVVEDDAAIRDAVCFLLRSVDLKVELFDSAEAFLDTYQGDRPGCLVTDVRMTGVSGLELQETLAAKGYDIPVIINTGHGDVPMAVRAMKAGAVNFIEKPFEEEVLLESVRLAIDAGRCGRQQQLTRAEFRRRLARLTPRERDVMQLVVDGHPNKVVASRLGISPRTVEIYRARVMQKIDVRSLPELVRLVIAAGANRDFPDPT